MEKTKIGVIGAGVLGCHHLEKCRACARVNLVGFFEVDTGRRAAVAERLRIRAYESAPELIDACDALIVATPATTHHDVALACLSRRRHVLVEKPLASSVAQGAELVAAARTAGVVLHVGHSEAFNPAVTALLRRPPQPRFMEIHRLAEFSPRGIDVSVVFDLMVHDLHLVYRLCGGEQPAADGIAATGVPVISRDVDIVNARLTFPSGCVVNLTASRISTKRMRKVRIFAPATYLSLDLDRKELVRCTLAATPPGTGSPVAMTTEAGEPADALECEQAAFIAAIDGSSTTTAGTSGAEALEVLKMAEAIVARVAGAAGPAAARGT